MPAESPPARCAARFLAAVACSALVLLPASGALAQATEDAGGTSATGGQEANRSQGIADALAESPVYVDPAYAGAFPEEDQERIAEAIKASGMDLFVIAVPLVEGDDWNGEAETLVSVVHDRRGGGYGHYIAVQGSGLYGTDFTRDTGVSPAFHGALTSSYATDFSGPLLSGIDVAVETALSSDPEAAYDEAVAAYDAGSSGEDRSATEAGSDGNGAALAVQLSTVVGIGVLVVAAGAFATVMYRRRTGRVSVRRSSSITQHAAFDNARRAELDSLVEQGELDLIEVGERLSGLETDGALSAKAGQSLQRALDARAAAAGVHDRMAAEGATLPDAVGVLVLLDMAEDAVDNVIRGARAAVVRRRHCYANPLHGTNTKVTAWREFGGTRTVRVPLCAECARAVRDRVRPVVLPAEHEGETVPYYEVPAEESVWAATGYGTLTDDLVQRVQRGDHRRGRAR